jgi:ABC-type bacteriocin/lantibiotic exporter with double-glycine peptidase domain
MRARIDGAKFRSGDVLNRFRQATKVHDFVLYHLPHVVFDAGGAIVALALMLYYDLVVGLTLLVVTPLLAFLTREHLGALRLVADDYYASIGARQNVLSESVNGITTIKALARGADRILVLEAGRLVGDGPHEQLVKTVPEYASLWSDYARSLEGASS